MTDRKYKKKLIEVAMPLAAINKACSREKVIRHGHPSTLHLYWARRPLAACRAVLFAQLIDDPSSHPEKFPTKEDQKTERERLFKIMEDIIIWENITNEGLYKKANSEILKSCDGELPSIYDPFSGGGSIPLEALRLGLPSYGSDLNPIAIMISKAMVEIPTLFKDMKPIHPGVRDKLNYKNAEGLAEDVKYYGEWMRKKAFERVGHLYPKVDIPKKYGGGKGTVIAWIWTRTVPSPDPAFAGSHVPIASSFVLSKKRKVIIEAIIDKTEKKIEYKIKYNASANELNDAEFRIKKKKGANFICIFSNAAINSDYIKCCGKKGEIHNQLIAIVAEGEKGRVYVEPQDLHINILKKVIRPETHDIKLPDKALGYNVQLYGFQNYSDLFFDRQLMTLKIFLDLLYEVREQVKKDAILAGLSSEQDHLRNGGINALSISEAISVYLGFAVSKCSDYWSSICTWNNSREIMRNTFGRQAIPMTWDFAECNPFSNSSGNWMAMINWVWKVIALLPCGGKSFIKNADAQTINYKNNTVISTDPPYYDNISYADLSDFFYKWMKPALKLIYPDIFNFIATPKTDELVAEPYRHGGRKEAEIFFLEGMKKTIRNMAKNTSNKFPSTIYYAFKQTEIEKEGISSTGWATFLEALIQAGYSIVATWPMRTEMASRMRGLSFNALSNSIVLVCRKREDSLGVITRAEFVNQLKSELPKAIFELKQTSITPADLPQSSIGPGIAIFSRYKSILENDDTPMSVKTALQLINKELSEDQIDYDAETSFAITWFEQFGFNTNNFGTANNIANAKGISVETLIFAGIAKSSAGKFSLLNRNNLEDDWNPKKDKRLTVWECCQYLIKCLENKGEFETSKLIKIMGSDKADLAKQLSYSLYDISSNKLKDASEATAYNSLIAVWTDLITTANTITENDLKNSDQLSML